MKAIIKIAVGIILAIVVVAVAAVACLAGAANEVQKDSDEHSITDAQFKDVKMGSTMQDVKKALGDPNSDDHQKVQGLTMDCIYYNQQSEVMSMYQFCFENGNLSSKSRY